MTAANTVEDYFIDETAEVPNNFLLPLIIYRGAVKDTPGHLAARFETIFAGNGWKPAWRYHIYDYAHYHSTAHEVIGIYRGRAKVLFGHTGGIETWLEPGDVVVIPAGVGHQCLESTSDFHAVGAYPEGQEPDIIRSDASQKAEAWRRIEEVPLPDSDPVHGPAGPLVDLW